MMQEGEKLISNYVKDRANIEYMDASISMLDESGMVKKDIFIEDGLVLKANELMFMLQSAKPSPKEFNDILNYLPFNINL